MHVVGVRNTKLGDRELGRKFATLAQKLLSKFFSVNSMLVTEVHNFRDLELKAESTEKEKRQKDQEEHSRALTWRRLTCILPVLLSFEVFTKSRPVRFCTR